MYSTVFRWYSRLRRLGVVVHELAHAAAVTISGGEITDLDLTAHVKHRGRYSLLQQLAISYAPVAANSAVAAGMAAAAMRVPGAGFVEQVSTQLGGVIPASVLTPLLQGLLLVIAFAVAAAALPSYTDAKSPYQRFRHNLAVPTLTRLVTLPLAVVVLLACLVPLGFTFLRSRSHGLRVVSELAFATLVVLQATGTVVVVEPATVWAVLGDFVTGGIRIVETAAT
ncbi:MAG: hypothetical protein A07HN63_00323 [uncultured archaeon A07HN63]|nr:MAG: hypothetical protein A07HN63_00323 [uncultured archaeon A07HN63]